MNRRIDQSKGPYDESGDRLWDLILAPTFWAIHFVTIYATTAVWCAKLGENVGALRLTIAAETAVALVLVGWRLWRSWVQWDYMDDWDYEHDAGVGEDRHEFLGHAGFLLAVVSAVGVIFNAWPALWIATCR